MNAFHSTPIAFPAEKNAAESLNGSDIGDAARRLSGIIAPLGREIVELAGDLDIVREEIEANAEALAGVVRGAEQAKTATKNVAGSASKANDAAKEAAQSAATSRVRVAEAVEKTKELADWAQRVGERFEVLRKTLTSIEREADEISAIAQQVNMLAINASIEAVRAGAAGRGFAVVASAVNDLAGTTAQTANRISKNLHELRDQATEMISEGGQAHGTAMGVIERSEMVSQAVGEVEEVVSGICGMAEAIASDAQAIDAVNETVFSSVRQIGESATTSARAIGQASARNNKLIDVSEELVSLSGELGVETGDSRFIIKVLEMAAEISRRFEEGVARGAISEAALFDQRYQPVPNTEPKQVMAPFTLFTDRVLPDIQEAALNFDPKVVFCAAVDRNGYLPTHNRKFSQPQGPDPVWNTANCRNRRIFDDRVGLKAGRNTQRYLLQTYRREMGDGFVMMKDLSAPLFVNGKHWGGLRFAYKY